MQSLDELLFVRLTWIANGMALGAAMKDWTDHQARQNSISYWADTSRLFELTRVTPEELAAVPYDKLYLAGFRPWDTKEGYRYMMCPLWIRGLLTPGLGYYDKLLNPMILTVNTDLSEMNGGCIMVMIRIPHVVHEADSYVIQTEDAVVSNDDGARPFEINEELATKHFMEAVEPLYQGKTVKDLEKAILEDEYLKGIAERNEQGVVHPFRDDEHQ